MFFNCFLSFKDFQEQKEPKFKIRQLSRKKIGCSRFVKRVTDDFPLTLFSRQIKDVLVKATFSSYCLKLRLPAFLKCFLTSA